MFDNSGLPSDAERTEEFRREVFQLLKAIHKTLDTIKVLLGTLLALAVLWMWKQHG
jgi:hypothetical protein